MSDPNENSEFDMAEKLPSNCDLSLDVMKIPDTILFPEELNVHLKQQIEYLTHENGMLKKNLSEREQEVKAATDKAKNMAVQLNRLQSDTCAYGSPVIGTTGSLVSSKLVELSKKLREKSSELECCKTKCSQLQHKIRALQECGDSDQITVAETPPPSTASDVDQIKILQDKLSAASARLFESRNTNAQLKNELKLANRLLQQEIGESFTSIQNLANEPFGWRGRAQQILSLQQKNSELQERLSLSISCSDTVSQPSQKNENRKAITEQLTKEINDLNVKLEDTKKKLDASRARCKVLETETTRIKTKLNGYVDKSKHDDDLIKMMKGQIASFEETRAEYLKSKETQRSRIEEENRQLRVELSKEKCKNENVQRSLSEKDLKIDELRSQLKGGRCLSPLQTSNETHAALAALETEKKRLLELITVLNDRLDQERKLHDETQTNFRKERQKTARLEIRLSRIEMEQSMNKPHTYSRTSTKLSSEGSKLSNEFDQITYENLKNKLELAEENILALQTRLQILQNEKDADIRYFANVLEETQTFYKK